mgnify:CR=1 FL=1
MERTGKEEARLPECLVLFLCLFSLTLFGGLERWAQAVSGICAGAGLIAWASRENPLSLPRSVLYPAALFFLLIVASQIRLPYGIVEFFSPERGFLYRQAGAAGAWVSLSLHPDATQTSLLLFLCAFVVYAAGRKAGNRTRYRIILILAVAGIVAACVGLAGVFYPTKKLYWLRPVASGHPVGPFVNRNHFAAYMNCAIGFCLWWAMLLARRLGGYAGETKRLRLRIARVLAEVRLTIVAPFLISVATAGAAFSLSRSGMVAWAAMMAVFFLWALARNRLALIASVGALIVAAVLVAALGRQQVIERVSSLRSVSGEVTAEMRLAVWKDAVAAWKKYPLIGIGAGAFATVYPAYKTNTYRRFFEHPENEYVELLTETGVTGAALVVCFFLACFLAGRRGAGTAYAVVVLVPLAVQSCADYILHVPSVLFPAAFCLGVISRGTVPVQLASAKGRVPAGRIVSLAAGVWMVLFGAQMLAGDFWLWRSARSASAFARNFALRRAYGIRPGDSVAACAYGRFLLEDGWKVEVMEGLPRGTCATLSVKVFQDAWKRHPADWRFPYYLAFAGDAAGDPAEETDRRIAAAARLNPTGSKMLINLAALSLPRNPEQARALCAQAIRVTPYSRAEAESLFSSFGMRYGF